MAGHHQLPPAFLLPGEEQPPRPHARQALASALSEWVKCEQGFLADKATVILSEVAGVTERPLGLEASSVSCCLCDLRKVTMPFFSFWPLIM